MSEIVTRLQQEARTYQANGNPVHSLLSLAASEIIMLRAMVKEAEIERALWLDAKRKLHG